MFWDTCTAAEASRKRCAARISTVVIKVLIFVIWAHCQAHGVLGNILLVFIITQLALGVYLKLHIHEQTTRPYVVPFHGVIGKAWPVLGWTQVLIPLSVLAPIYGVAADRICPHNHRCC
jgi:hypothetical protein